MVMGTRGHGGKEGRGERKREEKIYERRIRNEWYSQWTEVASNCVENFWMRLLTNGTLDNITNYI